MSTSVENDPVLTAIADARAAAKDRYDAEIAHLDLLADERRAHLKGKQPSKATRSGASKDRTDTGNKSLKRERSGIMKEVQAVAKRLIDANGEYTTTGLVRAELKRNGYTIPSPKPSRRVSTYLRKCKELENFPLSAESNKFGWRYRKGMKKTPLSHVSNAAA